VPALAPGAAFTHSWDGTRRAPRRHWDAIKTIHGRAHAQDGGAVPERAPLLTPHPISVDLQAGWSCSFHFKQGASGGYAGVAEIALHGLRHGELVIMAQPSLDAAVARVKLRASQFVSARSEGGAHKPWRQRL